MRGHVETIDIRAGMAAAIVAPALAGAILGLAGGPGFAFAVFLAALGIAGMHVTLLALPLYGLLRLLGWHPATGAVLVAALVIGALPAGILFNIGGGVFGGLFGLIGGGAFCAMSVMRTGGGERL
jgi:hypothetical protein